MTEAVKGLQLLVDSFAGTLDPDERDELLQEIIAHETPQAVGFLRLVANNPEEDRYLRCDAMCAVCKRTGGGEYLEQVLLYLSNPYDAYEYTSACSVIGAIRLEAAIPLVMGQFDAPLEEACLDATIDAVIGVGGETALLALHGWLDAQKPGEVDEERALLVIGAVEGLRGNDSKLLAFAERMGKGPVAAAARDAAAAIVRGPIEEEGTEDADDGVDSP